MPAPRELSQQIPAPWKKLGCKSPRVGANFWCKFPRVRRGMVMDKIDTCIRRSDSLLINLEDWINTFDRPPFSDLPEVISGTF